MMPWPAQRLASLAVAALLSVISMFTNAQSAPEQNQSASQEKQAPADQKPSEEDQTKAQEEEGEEGSEAAR